MKKFLLVKFLFCILFLNACTNISTGPPPVPCDDTEQNLDVMLNWQNVSYKPGFTLVASTPAPLGPFETYQTNDSQTAPSNNSVQYYCKVIILSGCSKSIPSTYSKSYLWISSNLSSNHLVLKAKGLTNEPTQITVEYYCPCLQFTSPTTTVINHPYFLGVTTIPAGASTVNIQMTQQINKPC
jgi:hypothetical protein